MNVFDSCTFCSSRASSLTEGRPAHVWPDVFIGRSFQCGYFLFGWFLCPCPPHLLLALPPSFSYPMLYASNCFYSSCVQHLAKKRQHGVQQLGPTRQSEEEGSGGLGTARRGAGRPPSCSLPTSTFRVKFKATRTRACVVHRRKYNEVHSGKGGRKEHKLI